MMRRVLSFVLIGLVLASSGMMASAGTGVPRTTTSSEVLLTSQHLPLFIAALPFVSDPADKAILKSSIQFLQDKRIVTLGDLETFAAEQNVNRSFYTGTVISHGDFGKVYFFPRLLYSIWLNNFGAGAFMFMLPAICSFWEAFDYPEYNRTAFCIVNGETVVEGNNSGFFIGGIGGFERDSGEEQGYPYFEYFAAALLIIVRS